MPNHVYLLFEVPENSVLFSTDLANEKIILVKTVIYEGVRSNELHLGLSRWKISQIDFRAISA